MRLRRATPDDVDGLAAMLARAFLDDPGTIVFEPDRSRRLAIMEPFFRTFLVASLAEDADLVVPADRPAAGLASWFGPGRHAPSEAAMAAAGEAEVRRVFGPEASARMISMTTEIERRHDLLTSGPHLRLEFYGVDPSAQGTGLGSALIEHGHARADAAGLACYLETFTERNVAFYRRRGYDVVEWYEVGDGVPIAALVRPPSRDATRR